MFIKVGIIWVEVSPQNDGGTSVFIRADIPPLVNLPLMLHIAWVLSPYLSEKDIQAIAQRCGHCECIARGGCDSSCLPF